MILTIVKIIVVFVLAIFVAIMLTPLYLLYQLTGRIKWSEVKKIYELLFLENEK